MGLVSTGGIEGVAGIVGIVAGGLFVAGVPGSLLGAAAPALDVGAALPAVLGLLEPAGGVVAAGVLVPELVAELPALAADGGIATEPAVAVDGAGVPVESSPPQPTAARTLVQAIEITPDRHNGLAMPTS
ncbi:MAG TPA: hypothetical protein VFG30_31235 [Polyangiales bacterium]|nr:hypothetical protein [Polyangiales bacterium]